MLKKLLSICLLFNVCLVFSSSQEKSKSVVQTLLKHRKNKRVTPIKEAKQKEAEDKHLQRQLDQKQAREEQESIVRNRQLRAQKKAAYKKPGGMMVARSLFED